LNFNKFIQSLDIDINELNLLINTNEGLIYNYPLLLNNHDFSNLFTFNIFHNEIGKINTFN
jgi:hypothetical protein